MFDFFKNLFMPKNKYKTNSEAIVISCFFNPQNSEYRRKAFDAWYETIKHLNHKVIECVIGDGKPQLPSNPNIEVIYTQNLLWHKESILNKIIDTLPKKFKYVFWLDADVIFENKNWLVEGVKQLQENNIIQPFGFCYHLEKDETKPNLNSLRQRKDYKNVVEISPRSRRVWRSFCATYVNDKTASSSTNYDLHGHVGFAWGAKREILDQVPLYDRALIGGADHIIAHAAANQIPCSCIQNSFTDNLAEVYTWSREFADVVDGKIGYVTGDLYHIWHGDVENREYLKRIKEFTPVSKTIKHRDKNGLHVTGNNLPYIQHYFDRREVTKKNEHLHTSRKRDDDNSGDDGFLTSAVIGYATDSTLLGTLAGGNVLGAMVGDALNNSHNSDNNFGGGDTGGSGSESNYNDSSNNDSSYNNDTTSSNFS